MAPLPLTVAKNRQIGFLLGVKKRIATLKKICDDPEKQELDRLSTAIARRAKAWRKYKSSQQDILGLIAEDKVVDEQVTFTRWEETYEAAFDEANKIINGKLRAEEGRNPRLE